MQPKRLEQYKYFQPIAWTLCFSFAGFVAMLALELKVTVERMHESNISFESRLERIEEVLGVPN